MDVNVTVWALWLWHAGWAAHAWNEDVDRARGTVCG